MKKKTFSALLITGCLLVTGCAYRPLPEEEITTSSSQKTSTSGGGSETSTSGGGSVPTGTYDVTVWTPSKLYDLTSAQIQTFKDSHSEFTLNVTLNPVEEDKAASQMSTAPEEGADLYFFAQDQLASLKQAGGVYKLDSSAEEFIKSSNIEKAANAAMMGNGYYAYPVATNGYFLYYDKSVLSETDVESVEGILAKCEANSRYFNFNITGSAFYTCAYFFGVDTHSNWTIDDQTGAFKSYDDNFNSENGLKALKAMKTLVTSSFFKGSATVEDFTSKKKPAAAVVAGLWDYAAAKNALGDNLGCVKLPTFTQDDTTYQLGSFTGYKMIGLKKLPKSEANKSQIVNLLAQYLSGETCQLQRFSRLGWGPTNANVLEKEAVLNHDGYKASKAQDAFAVSQGLYPQSWWSAVSLMPTQIKNNKAAADETYMRNLLTVYDETIATFIE